MTPLPCPSPGSTDRGRHHPRRPARGRAWTAARRATRRRRPRRASTRRLCRRSSDTRSSPTATRKSAISSPSGSCPTRRWPARWPCTPRRRPRAGTMVCWTAGCAAPAGGLRCSPGRIIPADSIPSCLLCLAGENASAGFELGGRSRLPTGYRPCVRYGRRLLRSLYLYVTGMYRVEELSTPCSICVLLCCV